MPENPRHDIFIIVKETVTFRLCTDAGCDVSRKARLFRYYKSYDNYRLLSFLLFDILSYFKAFGKSAQAMATLEVQGEPFPGCRVATSSKYHSWLALLLCRKAKKIRVLAN